MKIRIVPMEERHIRPLAELERLCFSEPWTESGLRAELENESAVFRVAEALDPAGGPQETVPSPLDGGNRVLGYAGMHAVCGECYVDNIAVFPEERGRGVGRALTKELLDWAEEQKSLFVTLEVRPSNAPAVELYRSLGFQEVGRRPGFYTHPPEDALLMTRFLEQKNP